MRRDGTVEFEKYQAIPQYRALNPGMSLDAFKTIYWWEWTHRLLGRAIGAAFLLPLLWFLWRGWIGPGLRGRLWAIFGLGALQGAVGWWMVASGLADRVEVSQYRLGTHLLLACVIYVALLWTARRLDERPDTPSPARVQAGAIGLLVLVLAQIYLGALVAGLRAGHIYNTWPLIDGALVPDASRLFFDVPLWRNFFENTLTVQFDHRMLAYAIFLVALLHAFDVAGSMRKATARRRRGGARRSGDAASGDRNFHARAGGADRAWADAPGDGDAGADGGDIARRFRRRAHATPRAGAASAGVRANPPALVRGRR